ncbi:hypothetical protein EDC04DRAFT_2606427 [Pisolithus marmoratus]|nr:hypothetical protein EDC04DRAFT_2606427 [Pisolithus marmoratus]
MSANDDHKWKRGTTHQMGNVCLPTNINEWNGLVGDEVEDELKWEAYIFQQGSAEWEGLCQQISMSVGGGITMKLRSAPIGFMLPNNTHLVLAVSHDVRTLMLIVAHDKQHNLLDYGSILMQSSLLAPCLIYIADHQHMRAREHWKFIAAGGWSRPSKYAWSQGALEPDGSWSRSRQDGRDITKNRWVSGSVVVRTRWESNGWLMCIPNQIKAAVDGAIQGRKKSGGNMARTTMNAKKAMSGTTPWVKSSLKQMCMTSGRMARVISSRARAARATSNRATRSASVESISSLSTLTMPPASPVHGDILLPATQQMHQWHTNRNTDTTSFVTSTIMAVKPKICTEDVSFKCPSCHELGEHDAGCKLSPYYGIQDSIHSEVNHGDLFVGKDRNGSDVAMEVEDFMSCLFILTLDKVAYASMLFMLMCGHLVTFEESYMAMKQTIMHLQPKYTIMFTTPYFISAVVKAFVMTYSIQDLIQGHDLLTIFQVLLNTSINLHMHADVIVFYIRGTDIHGTTVITAHGMLKVWCYPAMVLIETCTRRSEVHSEPLCNEYEIQGDKFSGWIKYTIWATETTGGKDQCLLLVSKACNVMALSPACAHYTRFCFSQLDMSSHLIIVSNLEIEASNAYQYCKATHSPPPSQKTIYEMIGDRGFFLQHLSFRRMRCLTQWIQGPSLGTCSHDPHGFHYWISHAQRDLGHPTTTFVSIWQLVPLFMALAYHEMDNYANHAAILHWTAAFEPCLFYWGLMLTPQGYYVDDDGHFIVY